MVIILFGLAGSGKNFVGSILEQEFGFHFIDADEFLTDEMRKCVEDHQPFEQSMRDRYTQLVIQKIKDLTRRYKQLAISKALYKEQNRQDMLHALPNLLLVQIKSDPAIIAERISTRDHLINESYAQLISKGFQEPAIPHEKVINNTDEHAIIEQLKKILENRSNDH